MRRSILVPAALLFLSGLSSACAASAGDAAPATIAPVTQSSASIEPDELDASEPEDDWGIESASASVDPNVISFDDESGPAETVVAPPKREDIPGFQLFGTGPTESDPGPKLSLPDDME